jgi:hypothetical protein
MDREFPIVEWDGFHFGAVLTYWSQLGTLAGTVWRLVMDRGKTLVVVPYQTMDAPAPDMHLAPGEIVPVLAGIDFGWTVGRVASANVHIDRNWEWIINGRVESNLNSWREKQNFPAIEKFYQARADAQKERRKRWVESGFAKWEGEPEKSRLDYIGDADGREKISNDVFAPLHEMQNTKELVGERQRIEIKRKEIEKQWRAKIETAKARREREIEAERLEELREMLAGYGVTKRGKKWLKALYDFIRNEVCSGNRMNPAIGEYALRRVVAKVEELTAEDISARVIESIPFVKGEIFNDEARQNILERVRFVAEFADGRKALVESVEIGSHCGRDAELFELVKPDEQERENIENQIEMNKAQFDANPSGDIHGENLFISITEAKNVTGWPTEKFDLLEEEGRLIPLDLGKVKGGKRRPKRQYFRADFEKLLHEEREKQKKFASV